MEKCGGKKNALYQGKDAYSSGTPCGRKFYWRAQTQSFFCHSLKQCHCRSLLNLECGLWCSLQGLSSGRRVHIYMCTCVSVFSPERVESKFLMEKYRRLSFVKDRDLGFYPDKTLNIHFTDGDLNGAWWCHIQLAVENPRQSLLNQPGLFYTISHDHIWKTVPIKNVSHVMGSELWQKGSGVQFQAGLKAIHLSADIDQWLILDCNLKADIDFYTYICTIKHDY